MNYYPFHMGDYACATRHLSWDEDAAYRRLLDIYYTTERAIPAAKVYRLVIAVTDAQREAVDVVLSEFFTLTPDGWVQERCEAEIDAMRVKQSAQEAKESHESDRMQRYRERRASMFEALRRVDVVPPWDVSMKELQRLVETRCNAPVTTPTVMPATQPETAINQPAMHLQRVQVVSAEPPATAISTNTNTNTNTNKGEGETRRRAITPDKPEDVDQQVWQDWAKLRKAKKATVSPTVVREARIEAGKAGLTLERFLSVWCARGSQGLMADWLKPNERGAVPTTSSAKPGRHTGFDKLNYTQGIEADGSFA